MSNNLHRVKTSKKAEYRHIQATARELGNLYETKDMLGAKKIILREFKRYLELKNRAMLRSYIDLLGLTDLPSDEYKAAATVIDELDIDIRRQELQKNEFVMGLVYLAQENLENIRKSQKN